MIDQRRLAEPVTVYRRSGQLYRNDLGADGQWVRPPDTAPAIEAERGCIWTRAESENFYRDAVNLSQRMEERWRSVFADIARVAEPLMHPSVPSRQGTQSAEASLAARNAWPAGCPA
jgi:hypothetical protein